MALTVLERLQRCPPYWLFPLYVTIWVVLVLAKTHIEKTLGHTLPPWPWRNPRIVPFQVGLKYILILLPWIFKLRRFFLDDTGKTGVSDRWFSSSDILWGGDMWTSHILWIIHRLRSRVHQFKHWCFFDSSITTILDASAHYLRL